MALVDLDIVNPTFAAPSAPNCLKRKVSKSRCLPSPFHGGYSRPAAEIQSVFEPGRYERVVIDVGGDEVGATALGAIFLHTARARADDGALRGQPFRPLSGTEEDICALFELIVERSRIRPDGLVNNANLQRQTAANDLTWAQALLEKVSDRLSLPVVMVAGYARLRAALPKAMQEQFFPLNRDAPEWMENDPE